ncbi:polypeptide N-acetylgalactosaminyltransferase 15-like [Watersipora subatra]|uniref:polypeptide N-acetylgalactosaminyltransferase 15-like n=1 Tax=Watersipora subatra TaxID=2589382 RepID=UPI00355B0761
MLTHQAQRNVTRTFVGFLFLWIIVTVIEHHTQVESDEQHEVVPVTEEQVLPVSLKDASDNLDLEIRLQKLRWALYNVSRPDDEKYAINETKSQTLSVTRGIPDNRPPECLQKIYNTSNLPTISVIIPVYNEAPSMLLRTIHSILTRTPPSLLADVILVDDMSTNDNMKQVLTNYVAELPKVKIMRLKKKAHLIRARMAGASIAKGDVLLFQDGHTEMNVGWAEPVLDYIRSNREVVMQPTIDDVDQWTIVYQPTHDHSIKWRGVFLWDMRYAWNQVPRYYKSWLSSDAEPYPCPVLVGCSIAVDRSYFYEIGGFDTGLDIYGGEQIELSFRTWMCGGRVFIHPCSRIGHVFKPWMKSDVYWRKREQAIARNSIRLGESWMGSYVSYYYASSRIYDFKQVELSLEEKAGILTRRQLARELDCKGFNWYLNNVLPELKPPHIDSTFYGEVSNAKSSLCLAIADDGYVSLTSDCYIYSRYRQEAEFSFRSTGQLMRGTQCVMVDDVSLLQLVSCNALPPNHGAIVFHQVGELLTKGNIIYVREGEDDQCLEQITNVLSPHIDEQMPQFRDCDITDTEFSQWLINYHFEYNLVPPPLFDEDVRIRAN